MPGMPLRNSRRDALAVALAVTGWVWALDGAKGGNWPSWRGASGDDGVARESDLPLDWNATRNIRWKVALPDPGNSTPIVWGNHIFLTQAVASDQRRTLICLDRKEGRVLWQKGPVWTREERSHATNPFCSASPVTDGERVVAWFGSAGLYAYDLEGKELWQRDLGIQDHEWGYGSSPILYKDLCILFFGPGERQFLLAVDKRTGKSVWQKEPPAIEARPRTDGFRGRESNGIVGAFGSPILVQAGGRDELVMSFPQRLCAYDPMSGQELWSCDGMNELIYTSAIAGDGLVVGMGGFMGTAMAVKAGGDGDVTDTHRLWRQERTKNRIGSGVIHDGHIYILNSDGIAECFELRTGTRVWDERLPVLGPKSESWSCMTLAGDRIYVPNQSGDVVVLKASPTFEVLGVNGVGNELTNASLAASDGELFLRTHQHLYCISIKGD